MVSEDYVLIGDRLYFVHMTNGSYPKAGIYCVDVKSGEAEAVFETCDFLRTVGVYRDGCFYFTSLRGLFMAQDALYCLDPETGETMWANDERAHGSNCTILVEGDVIYHAKSGGHVYCCNKNDGKTVWTYGNEEWCRGIVSVDADTLLFVHTHGKYLFFDKGEGRLLREDKAGGKLMKSPLVLGKRVFSGENAGPSASGASGGRMMCYEIGDSYEMKPVFEVPAAGAITSRAVIDGEKLYFGIEGGALYCVSSKSGDELEKKRKVKGACRNIVVHDSGIVALSDKGPAMGLA